MSTSFTPILQRAVESTPGAWGAIFADAEGEAVDSWSTEEQASLPLIGAHYGIVLARIQKMLHLFHFGEAQQLRVACQRMELLVHVLTEGYFAVLVADRGLHLATALRVLETTSDELQREMGL